MASASGTDAPAAPWADLFRGGQAAYTVLLTLGVLLHALPILIIAIILPTVVADLGGAAYYTWAAMLYTIGAIVGAASVGPVWSRLGARRGYAASALVLLAGTLGCALAPDMAALIAARAVQGFAGGLVVGGGMALVGALFPPALRTRILALYQGMWTLSHLSGPIVGGLFAELGWWRGSFWALVPPILVVAVLAWRAVPAHLEAGGAEDQAGFPALRLMMLTAGVFCIAAAGPVDNAALRPALIAAAVAIVWLAFRRDAAAENRLFPRAALSLAEPVGLALWILLLAGVAQNAVTLFLPLLLQKVHGVSPLFISYVTIVISFGWTIGTFAVSGWTGPRQRLALLAGPAMMLVGVVGITLTAQEPLLEVLTVSAFVLGLGVGVHNVHLLARTIAAAAPGEERVTAAAMPSIRSLGTAFGAAISGMLASVGGLDTAATPDEYGAAITLVYAANIAPLAFAVWCMTRLVRHAAGARAAAA